MNFKIKTLNKGQFFIFEKFKKITKKLSTVIKNLIPFFEKEKCEYWIEEYGFLAEVRHPKSEIPFFVIWSIIQNQDNVINKILKDKIFTKKILDRNNISVPSGIIIISKNNQFFSQKQREEVRKFIENKWFPLVWKPINGSLWDWVVLLKNIEDLKKNLEYADFLSNHHLIEEYVEWKEYRVTLFDGEILFAYEKVWNNFVKNITKWSDMIKVKLSENDKLRIKEISKIFSLQTAGFDIISSGEIKDGKILEINGNPWLKWLSLLSKIEQENFWEKMRRKTLKINKIV